MEVKNTNTEIPEEKKETTSVIPVPVPVKNSEVQVSPQNTKNEVSVEDISKLYKVIEEQKKETESLKKLLEDKKEKQVEKKEKQVERSSNIIENSESDEDKIDNSKVINGVFVK